MRESISVSLPPKALKRAKRFCKKEDLAFSELVQRAVRAYILDVEMDALCRQAKIEAVRRGINLADVDEQGILKSLL